MPRPRNREEALAGLRASISEGKCIVGAGAGIGLSAKSIEQGGGDLIIIYNSGRYRMAGRGSLAGLMPYGNANDAVLDMAGEVLPVVRSTPVLAGVCASDPFRDVLGELLPRLRDMGFAGVQNFPTVGLVDEGSSLRRGLEETGMGYGLEVGMVAEARRVGLLTTPYVFSPGDARRMAAAGADVLVAHMGLTSGGAVGAESGRSLDECVGLIREIQRAAAEVRGPQRRGGGGGGGGGDGDGDGEKEQEESGMEEEEVILLCHGGPIARPEDARYVMDRVPGLHGFYGASSVERLPVEEAIANVTREFKSLKPGPPS